MDFSEIIIIVLQVPKGRSAIGVTQLIRDKFFDGYKEAEFIVVCDVQKENSQIIQELNDAQVKQFYCIILANSGTQRLLPSNLFCIC